MISFESTFSQHLANYVSLRQSLGYKFACQISTLVDFDRFTSARSHVGPLTQEHALAFAVARETSGTNRRHRRYQVVRDFAGYLSAYEPSTPSLDKRALPSSNARPVPYVLSSGELDSLMGHAASVRFRNHGALCGLTYRTMFGLAASTGLRAGEVARLDQNDVDLARSQLLIRKTKFGKDRLVALHATTTSAMNEYSLARDGELSHRAQPAFFISMKVRRFAPPSIWLAFTKIAARAGLSDRATFHSLRHTFAVGRLAQWYRDGCDVNAMLPLLATYMGHVHYTSTAYYLTASAELLGLAAQRLHGGDR
jgi:integrase